MSTSGSVVSASGSGGVYPTPLSPHPPVDRQTLVKTLPCNKPRLWAVKTVHKLHRQLYKPPMTDQINERDLNFPSLRVKKGGPLLRSFMYNNTAILGSHNG